MAYSPHNLRRLFIQNDCCVGRKRLVEERSDEVSTPASAPESSANLNGWIARKTFNHRRRTMRARWSERAAGRDFRKPEQAAR